MGFQWFAAKPAIRVSVYRRTLLGFRLVGWVSEDGSTLTPIGRTECSPLFWSTDQEGVVYLQVGPNRAAIGRVESSGTVWSEVARPLSGVYDRDWRGSLAPRTFGPGAIFAVNPRGEVRARRWWGATLVGKVEGTADLKVIGALALLMLLEWA